MKYSLNTDYKDYSKKNIALIPVKKLFIDKKYSIGTINIYPPNSLNVEEIMSYKMDFYFNEYKEEFFGSTIIAIPTNIQIAFNFNPMPSYKKKLVASILSEGEGVLDGFRFVHSNFEGVSNLPSRSGYLNSNVSGVLIYSPEMRYFEFYQEKYLVNSDSIGVGLHIDIDYSKKHLDKYFKLYNEDRGEIGNVLLQALKLYSNIVYAENNTAKFMLAISLIEYLANPYKSIGMAKVKAKIVPFIAENTQEIHELSERFRELTSKEDSTGKQVGLRTNIVHNGSSIEDLVADESDIRMLLRELQRYITKVIDGLLLMYEQEWNKVNKLVENLRVESEKKQRTHRIKETSDVLILVDLEFFNKAIQEVYQMYPEHINTKINIASMLSMLVIQSDISQTGYKVPIQIFYNKENTMLFNSDVADVSKLEGLGFNFDRCEIDIYTNHVDSNYYSHISNILNEYLYEMNCIINSSAQFRKIVLISDRNEIDSEILKQTENSYKEIFLGRLDNTRTTSYDSLKWFDVQYFIMDYLGIDKTQEVVDDFIWD
jgi:hypothetical protein